jgi:hypothetical protein
MLLLLNAPLEMVLNRLGKTTVTKSGQLEKTSLFNPTTGYVLFW